MEHPTTRVLALLELLQARPGLTGAQLAQRLGVDQRTVRRYASLLSELGIPVHAERGRYGGYRLMPGYKLPPLMLTDDEATAVVLGLLAARQLGLATEGAAGDAGGDAALAKIDRVLPPALRDRTRALGQTLDFTRAPLRPRAPASDAVLTLADGARQRRSVRLRYASWRGERTERVLDPYGLVFHAGRWYVTGHDHLRGEVRTFRVDRVDRVHGARLTERAFADPGEFDPVQHVTASLAGVEYTWPVTVWLDTTLEQARRRIPPAVATLAEADGGVLMRARAERLDGMARVLAGLEWPFRIREPDELRAALREHATALARQSQ